jgi:hypothetical protein
MAGQAGGSRQTIPEGGGTPLPLATYLDVEADADAQIAEAIKTLLEAGANATRFTKATINALRMSVPMWIKETRAFLNLPTSDLMSEVIRAGVKAIDCKMTPDLDPKECLRIASWLKTKAGVEATAHIQFQFKLAKKASPTATPAAIAFVGVLDQQLNDLAAKRKEAMAASKAVQDDLKKQMEAERSKLSSKLGKLDKEHVPACNWTPPDKQELLDECWEMWKQRCLDRSQAVPVWNAILGEQAEKEFMTAVLHEFKLKFISNTTVQEQLTEYGSSKVLELSKEHERKNAKRIRRFLVTAGVDVARLPSIEEEAGDSSEGSGREADDLGGERQQSPPVIIPSPERAPEESDARPQAAARSQPPPAAARKSTRTVGAKSTDQRAQGPLRGKRGRHSNK